MLEAPLNEAHALKWIADPTIDVNGADYYKWTALVPTSPTPILPKQFHLTPTSTSLTT